MIPPNQKKRSNPSSKKTRPTYLDPSIKNTPLPDKMTHPPRGNPVQDRKSDKKCENNDSNPSLVMLQGRKMIEVANLLEDGTRSSLPLARRPR